MSNNREWMIDAACAGMDLGQFFPEPKDPRRNRILAEAQRICLSCPVIDACRKYAEEMDIPYGTYGGESALSRTKRMHGLTPFHAASKAARNRDFQPCGTTAAHRRHQRNGEIPCDPCRRAANRAHQDRQQSAERRREAK